MPNITCTITRAGRADPYGTPLVVGQSYSLDQQLAKSLCNSGFATTATPELLADAAPGSGLWVPVDASRDITDFDDGLQLRVSTSCTLTLRVGRKQRLQFTVRPASGVTVTIASDGVVLINGSTASITRTAASNTLFAVGDDGVESYWATGS